MPQTRTLGQYIAERRRILRLEQKEVSERLGQHGMYRAPTTVANWESDRQSVPPELIPALAKALEDSPVRLYELAGILSNLPGSEIVKLLDGLPQSEIDRIEKVIEVLVSTSTKDNK